MSSPAFESREKLVSPTERQHKSSLVIDVSFVSPFPHPYPQADKLGAAGLDGRYDPYQLRTAMP